MTTAELLTSDRERQLRYILEHPENTLSRLVYADRLEEEGEPERAEFIRVQVDLARGPVCSGSANRRVAANCSDPECSACRLRDREFDLFNCNPDAALNWFGLPETWARIARLFPFDQFDNDYSYLVVRNGFAEEWHGPTFHWSGVLCHTCEGVGLVYSVGTVNSEQWLPRESSCEPCGGTGRLARYERGPAIVLRHPITQVVATDQRAYPTDRDYRVAWFHPAVPGSATRIQSLPVEVFTAIVGWDNGGATPERVKWFDTRVRADAALSAAFVAVARRKAGLSPLSEG